MGPSATSSMGDANALKLGEKSCADLFGSLYLRSKWIDLRFGASSVIRSIHWGRHRFTDATELKSCQTHFLISPWMYLTNFKHPLTEREIRDGSVF